MGLDGALDGEGATALMEWVERTVAHGPALFLPRPGGQPVFVDPYGHRVRRLRYGARVVAAVATVYLALLALGLAGPATPPFSLFPGAGDKAGESGTEAVQTGGGATTSAEQVRDPSAGGPLLNGDLPSVTGSAPGIEGTAPPAEPSSVPPASAAPSTSPAAAPVQTPGSSHAPPAPSGRSGPPAGPPPKSSPPASNPGQGYGPPAGHVPPGQAKKPASGNGNGTGNAPPANHGRQMAAEHSRSPNH